MKQAPEQIPVQHLHTIRERQNTGARKRHMTLRDGMLINDEVRSCDEQRGLLLLLMLPNKVNARLGVWSRQLMDASRGAWPTKDAP